MSELNTYAPGDLDKNGDVEAFPIEKDISYHAYERICRDIRNQPKWRMDSDMDCDYYDGAQISTEVLERLKKAGIPPQDSNLIKPTINAVLGLEAKSRTDYKITSDDEAQNDMAEGLSAKIKEMESESRADRAMSDAYSSMIRSGIGWIEVGWDTDPLKYPYRVRSIHRNDIFWDWTAQEPDLSDARYLLRYKWVDRDQASRIFKKDKKLIQTIWQGWASVDVYEGDSTGLARAYENEQLWSRQQDEYLNRASGQIRISELWYRYHEDAFVLYLPDGRAIEYREDNPYHAQAVAAGLVQVQKAMIPKVRCSFWVGPHKLLDVPTPFPHRNFPYIPFWCFRKDRSRTPYGLIRDMRGPQDQIIDLDILLYELMNSVKVELDSDALDLSINTLDQVTQNLQSLRSVTVLNPMRRNVDGFKTSREHELAAQVFQLAQERKRRIEEVGGVYRAMLGQGTEASSGIAINNLVEQGATVLAEPNDNFRYARRICGQHLLSFATAEMVGKPTQVAVKRGARQKMIYFNREMITEDGPVVVNDVATAQVKVVLEDIPATPSFRAQQLQSFSQIVSAAPPEAQSVLFPIILELSDVPNRHEIADQVRKVMGIPGPQTPEEEQAIAQKQAEQEAMQKQMVVLEMQLKEAQVMKTQAEANRLNAQAAQPATGEGDTGADVAMVKLQAMQQELQATQQVIQLQQQIGVLRTQLANKAGELQLKAREIDVKEEQVHVDARVKGEQVNNQREQVSIQRMVANKPDPKPAPKKAAK